MSRRGLLLGAALMAASLGLMGPAPAWASQLDDLRKSGAVGEAYDGYTRARDGSAKGFVDTVNKQRRGIYVKRAKSEGVSPDQVGRVYALEIFKKAPKGTWFLGENGKWTQK
ncbi:YdbL family protein [Sneathiella chinensis]|nr:YdbL family protein [Sneathiella chinensis]